MSPSGKIIVLLMCLAVTTISQAGSSDQALILSSGEKQTTLLELYTSEGCSSCPPADRWLSGYKTDARLWKGIVPVAFHVDYWDYLGWRDRFSDKKYSRRQYDYKNHRHLKVVYTPGLMQNGREFRGWQRGRNPVDENNNKAGVLRAMIEKDKAFVEFSPGARHSSPLILNVALLGFDQNTQVAAGENRGRLLKHDFVVLELQQFKSSGRSDYRWQLGALLAQKPAQASGIALWVTAADDPTPLQATGGWLP